MARRLYLQTAHDLGGGEAAARNLVSTVMRHFLLQVAERDAAKQKMLKALLQELSRAEAASDTNVIWNLGQEMDVCSWHPTGCRYQRTGAAGCPHHRRQRLNRDTFTQQASRRHA
jgi:hypothetical protein